MDFLSYKDLNISLPSPLVFQRINNFVPEQLMDFYQTQLQLAKPTTQPNPTRKVSKHHLQCSEEAEFSQATLFQTKLEVHVKTSTNVQ